MTLPTQPPAGLPQAAIELLGRARAQRQNAYRLCWKGTNIPRGASIYVDNQLFMIFATQNGFVMAKNWDSTSENPTAKTAPIQ